MNDLLMSIHDSINELSASVIPSLWRASWQGGLALVIVYGLCRIVRRIPAQVRCWLWRFAYAKLVIAALWVTPIELPLLPAVASVARTAPPIEATEFTAAIPTLPAENATLVPAQDADPSPHQPFPIARWLFFAWFTGMTINSVRLLRHWLQAKRMLSRLSPVVCGVTSVRMTELCRRMNIRRPPELRTCHNASTPFLIGFLHPAIVLPMNLADARSRDELDAILAHELAHAKRHDLLWNWLPALVNVLFFFHPILWLTRREWRLSQEIAADELAITDSKLDVAKYANAIVELVSKSPRNSTNPHLAIALSDAYTQLAQRMTAMHSFPHQPRRQTAIAAIVAALAFFTIVPWAVTAQSPVEPPKQAASPATGSPDSKDPAFAKPANEQVDQEFPTHPISVSGRALDVDGNPLAGAAMYLSSQSADWKRLAETMTDREGRYEFRNIPLPLVVDRAVGWAGSGFFEVFGVAEGHGFGWRPPKSYIVEGNRPDNLEQFDPPDQFYGDEPIKLDVRFRPEAKLSGRVVDDAGQPIPNARIDIRYCDSDLDLSQWSTTQRGTQFTSLNGTEIVPLNVKRRLTDADGRFEFTGLPEDCRFSIDVRPPEFPARWIWAVTQSEFTTEADGRPIYSDGMELRFVRPTDVTARVVFDDTGEPAANVRVGAGNAEGGSSGITDNDGKVNLRLSKGGYSVELLPRIGTPYLVTNLDFSWPAENPEAPVEFRMHRAAVVEVHVVDEATGEGLPDVDFWSSESVLDIEPAMKHRELHMFRSYERETRICHVERPRTDATGTLKANFEPGSYRIGVGLNAFPFKDYRLNSDGQPVILRAGETTKVTFKFRRHGINKVY